MNAKDDDAPPDSLGPTAEAAEDMRRGSPDEPASPDEAASPVELGLPVEAAPRELSAQTHELRARLSDERWAYVEARAHQRVRVLAAVTARYAEGGVSFRDALAEVEPGLHWSTLSNWRRRDRDRQGAAWERQLDARVAPPRERLSSEVRLAACMLRRSAPQLSCEDAQKHLAAQFGPDKGAVSKTSLKRIWKQAGLAQPRGGYRGPPKEKVTRLSGGAGLALLKAAAVETGVVEELGSACILEAERMAAAQGEVEPSELDEHRDELGRLTGAYNRAVRGEHERDPRLETDAAKRQRRALHTLSILRSSPAAVGNKLLATGLSPLLTERRGFDGLESPAGAWLAAMGTTAYQGATLDKHVAELALAGVDGPLWTVHGQQWLRLTKPWRESEECPRWLRFVVYVDATQDPYWTQQFAVSGKVSRVGRIMPCLTRVALMGGPGVPLMVETYAGMVSLKKELPAFLSRAQAVLGAGELGRLAVLDAEMATVKLLSALAATPDTIFVTVYKGAAATTTERTAEEPWQRYRRRDLIRGVGLCFKGESAPKGGLMLRGVEMTRDGGRNPVTTLFVTNASEDELTVEEVPDAYLSRWPNQEQRFRDGRNGLGLNRTHGYGGHYETHVALQTARDKCASKLARAQAALARASAVEQRAQQQLDATGHGQRNDARSVLNSTKKARTKAERDVHKAERDCERLATTPREIYVRDTTRDSIVTCAKLTVLMLIEFVLKEYFGGLRMEARTFIDNFVTLPLEIRKTEHELVYTLAANPRSPANTRRLRDACAEITRRQLVTDGRRLRFQVVPNGVD